MGSGVDGQIQLDAGRNIDLADGGAVNAQGGVRINSDGSLTAGNAMIESVTADITILAADGIHLENSTLTGQNVHLETGAPFRETAADILVQGGRVAGHRQTTLIASRDLLLEAPNEVVASEHGPVHLQAGGNLILTAGTEVAAGGDFTAIAGESLQLRGIPDGGVDNGQQAGISAVGDVLLSGGGITLSRGRVNAGGGLAIEATAADIQLGAPAHVYAATRDHLQLTAVGDLAISAYQGGIAATTLDAQGKNIHVISNGLTEFSLAGEGQERIQGRRPPCAGRPHGRQHQPGPTLVAHRHPTRGWRGYRPSRQ